MALNLLPVPNGIDKPIQLMQANLFAFINSLWGTTANTYDCWGRVYRNYSDQLKGYVPEGYNTNNEYTPGALFFNDTMAVTSLFVLSDPREITSGDGIRAKLQLLFFLDLSQITPSGIAYSSAQRMDESAIWDVVNWVRFNGGANGCTFVPKNVYQDIDKVLERFSGSLKQDTLRRDMHPKFCFRVDLDVMYSLDSE